jgi:glycosyltransferase involved in cell wall biosynthesis
VTLLFVGRLSVRKGLDLIVALSHRLADLAADVQILVVGFPSLWSDYSGLLRRLHPLATFCGEAAPEDLAALYRNADALIQPSRYEPFGLTVAESLASGTPVVASDAVGAAEDVDGRCVMSFADGDVDDLERVVRELVDQVQAGQMTDVRRLARSEAERLFAPGVVATGLLQALYGAGAQAPDGVAPRSPHDRALRPAR